MKRGYSPITEKPPTIPPSKPSDAKSAVPAIKVILEVK